MTASASSASAFSAELEHSLLSLALAPPEHLINALIASDEHLAAQTSKFTGKSLAIAVQQPSLSFLPASLLSSLPSSLSLLLKFHQGGITLSPLKKPETEAPANTQANASSDTLTDAPPNAHIEGTLTDLLSLLTPPDSKARPLANPNITLSGDITFIQDLHQTMQTLDIDWQDIFAATPAATAGDVFTDLTVDAVNTATKEAQAFAANSSDSLKRNLKAYLTIETPTLVSRNELPPLVQRIEALTIRIDRATARGVILNSPPFVGN